MWLHLLCLTKIISWLAYSTFSHFRSLVLHLIPLPPIYLHLVLLMVKSASGIWTNQQNRHVFLPSRVVAMRLKLKFHMFLGIARSNIY
uniref:Uncharacterized protein MANES_10G135100 n=1 Tax=Rhizophora mucronata TaxID=61149 RepID=A0A2P2MNS0_RHIMU